MRSKVIPKYIQEAHPLKQGLKLRVLKQALISIVIQEAHPLKQGLKLFAWAAVGLLIIYDSRGASIKTRIETSEKVFGVSPVYPPIQEAHPLKQGLKQLLADWLREIDAIQEAHPLKQGLKQKQPVPLHVTIQYSRGASIKTRIETGELWRWCRWCCDSRGASIKTRIETF